MLYDHLRNRATPKQKSLCPCCRTSLLAKCERIKIWHWSHESLIDCDPWYEGMSAWHLDWQSLVKESSREIIIGEHRADICLSNGMIFELQHSPISIDDIEEREAFYGKEDKLRWIFDAAKFVQNLRIIPKISKIGRPYIKFKWRRPRLSITAVQSFPMYFDCGEEVIEVKELKYYENIGRYGSYKSWYGWGYQHVKDIELYQKLFGADYEPSITDPILPSSPDPVA
jgi:competence protein CoiA